MNKFNYALPQRRGLFSLVILLLGLQTYNYYLKPGAVEMEVINHIYDTLIPENHANDFSNLHEDHTPNEEINNLEAKELLRDQKNTTQLKIFDPNTIDSLGLKQMNIKHYVIKNMLNYRKKGGRFQKCSDLEKVYGMDSVQLAAILPFCKCNSQNREATIIPFDLNTADTSDLMQIHGIGPVLSSRIIKYRDRLGGFHDVQQLKEVYGIEAELIDANLKYFLIKSPVKRININSCSFYELYNHFYFDKNTANSIIKYRNQHNVFDSVGSLKEIKTLTDSLFNKISPYLEAVIITEE